MDARQGAGSGMDDRHKAEAQARTVPCGDDETTRAMRDWVKEMGFTVLYPNRTAHLAAWNLKAKPGRRELGLDEIGLLDHVISSCLGEDKSPQQPATGSRKATAPHAGGQ